MSQPYRQNLYTFSGNNGLRFFDADGREDIEFCDVVWNAMVFPVAPVMVPAMAVDWKLSQRVAETAERVARNFPILGQHADEISQFRDRNGDGVTVAAAIVFVALQMRGGGMEGPNPKGPRINLLPKNEQLPPEPTRAGPSEFSGPARQTERTADSGGKGVTVEFANKTMMDTTLGRVKEWVPNTHPDAPPDAMQKVKFDDALPGTKGYKRSPTKDDLEYLK